MRLAECVCEQLRHADRGEDAFTGDCCVMPGSTVPWDSCGCEDGKKDGRAWVSVVSGAPDESQQEAAGCITGTHDIVYQLGVLRCVPVGPGCGCECEEISSRKILGDLQALLKAAFCCFRNETGQNEFCEQPTISSWRTVGPEGGCAGVVVDIKIPTSSGACC